MEIDDWKPVDEISIHPPHAGRDPQVFSQHIDLSRISIHPPHAGRDESRENDSLGNSEFQSTRPMRDGTHRRFLR